MSPSPPPTPIRKEESIHLNIELLAHPAPYDATRKWVGPRSYWLCQLLGWGGLFILLASPLPLKARVTAAELSCHLTYVLSGLLLSHLLRVAIVHALDVSRRLTSLALRTVPWIVLSVLAHVLIQVYFTQGMTAQLNASANLRPEDSTFLFIFADNFALSAGIFVAWLGFYFALLTYRRYQTIRIERLQLLADVQEAAWKALQAQLNPHLLFNSLNSIRALIPRDQTAPREALTHLSELLRSSLTLRQNELIPFKREMETVESFLSLEELRFEQRLRVSRDIACVIMDWQVPPFLVQTLMENAVKYGVAPFEEGGEIHLTATTHAENLLVEVTNRGQLGRSSTGNSTGLGLSNLRSRLAILFGPAASLTLENLGTDQVRARVLIPKQRLQPHSN